MHPTSRVGTAAAAAAVSVVAFAAPAAAQSQPVQGAFTIQFPKGHPASNAPCPADVFCAVGSLSGYGAATITIVDETFEPIDDTDCLAVTRVEEIDLVGGGGTLLLDSVGTFCRPGGSGASQASDSSYGFPGTWSFTATVDQTGGTGVFAGVGGSGTESMVTAGGIGAWHLSLALTT